MLQIRQLAKNVASTVVMRVTSALASFAIFVLVARHWNSARLGEFATVFAIYMFLQQLPLLGLHIPLIRDLVRRPETLRDTAPSVAALGIGAAIVVTILLGVAGSLVYPVRMHPALWLAGIALVPGALACLGEAVLIAQGRMGRAAMIAALENVARAAVWLILVLGGAGLTSLFVALLAMRVLVLPLYFGTADMRDALRATNVRGGVVLSE